jgi:hypothetical protein
MYLSRTVRSLLALCSATLLSVVTLGVSVPIASSASGPTGPAASLPVEVCTGGVHLNLPTSSEVEADGWMRVDYDLGGLKASTEIPPVGFDPRQAPADVLARHDLPSRPATTAELDQWTAEMGRRQFVRTQGICGPLPFKMAGSYQYSINWGGDSERSTTSYYFQGAKGYHTQGRLSTSCGALSSLGQWVGLGGNTVGGYSPALLQAGTTALGPGFGQPPYNSFWEYIDSAGNNSGPWSFGNMAISPGDTIYNVVRQLSLTQGFVSVYDSTTGVSLPPVTMSISNTSGLGDFADFIDERAQIGLNQYAPLIQYGWTYWSDLRVQRSNGGGAWTGAYSEPNEYWVDMRNSGGAWLSNTTGTYSDNHMQDHWYACS